MTDQKSEDANDPINLFASTKAFEENELYWSEGALKLPATLGRYVAQTLLGSGGFADVFLAYDEKLDRQVALKIPRRDKFRSESQMKTFVEEARTAANLQHSGIVAVFDVGHEGQTPFIVLEYIRGRTLAHLLTHESLTPVAAARLIAEITEALAHAHEQGFVHRDIKPQNILLDNNDRPHIADFGLAIRHRDLNNVDPHIAGTTQYMSPEQIRGENHRLDCRTDIWALGVTLYRMLTGQLPFAGSTNEETLQKILYTEPEPPSRINLTVPAELERICLRCLSTQMSGRYRTAAELESELSEWLQFTAGESSSSRRKRGLSIEPPSAPVIPRGLRAFTKDDWDFFLKLIPGPRDRGGLPASVRFWKDNIEEREPGATFNVGLLYGPSGCGKSSLIKAGVLPRVGSDVVAIHLDSTPQTTESEILRLLRRRFKGLPHEMNLTDSLRELRESPELRARQKILIVFDQFEQWLHCWQTDSESELVTALRQCDGGNIQCLLMVRDDFWLPVSRFMRHLELGIVDGTNAMLVDSFDAEHAWRVLRELGVGYKRLPENPADQTEAQTAFIGQTIEDLTEDNRLYPVRLSVFVEMVKDRPWNPETLNEMGGAKGVGVAFLENSVGSRSRQSRRRHEQAARSVLGALIPESGNLKDSAKPRSELLRVSNYTARPKDFDDLMHLLDVELRLLTPTSSANEEIADSGSNSHSSQTNAEPVYQLTHDFLVPSIRTWLHRELRESRRGRARLLLNEQAVLWSQRPNNRSLPSLSEWLGLQLWTRRNEWTPAEQRMMHAANQRLLRQTGVAVTAVLIAAVISTFLMQYAKRERNKDEAAVLVSRLTDVSIRDVPEIVKQMKDYRQQVSPLIERLFSDDSQSDRNRIRAAMASLPDSEEHVEWLTRQLVSEQLPADDFLTVRAALSIYSNRVAGLLLESLNDQNAVPRQRFRLAAAIAVFDNSDELWKSLSFEVSESLLHEPATEATIWIQALKPVSQFIGTQISKDFAGVQTLESARVGVLAIEELSENSLETLTSLLPDSNASQYRAIANALRREKDDAVASLQQQLRNLPTTEAHEAEQEQQAKRIANVVLALYQLGDSAPLLEYARLSEDPRIRTRILHAATPDRIDLSDLMPAIRNTSEPDARFIVMSAANFHLDMPISRSLRDEFAAIVLQAFRVDPDPAIHSIAELLLRRLDPKLLEQETQRLIANGQKQDTRWFIDQSGQTMIVMDRAAARILDDDSLTFAIASAEVTNKQFARLFPNHRREVSAASEDDEIPVSRVLLAEAMNYCNYLSDLEKIPNEQWCYDSTEIQANNCTPPFDYRMRTGYRLPTDEEWEFACRADTNTRCFFGTDSQLAQFYGWDRLHSVGLLQQHSGLLPNPFGLFDVYGGVAEITVKRNGEGFLMNGRGSGCFGTADLLNSTHSKPLSQSARVDLTGIRVVRTIRLDLK